MRKIIRLMAFAATMLLAIPAGAQDSQIFNTLPRFDVKFDINYTTKGQEKNVDVRGRVHMSDFKLLADIYPFKHSSFHLTGGFYAGLPDLGTVHNTGLVDVDEGEGLEIGDVFVRPDENGTVRLKLQTNSFKPYTGLGFGRPISSKHKVSVAFDLGVMFWGTPALKVYSPDEDGWIKMKKDDIDDEGFHDAVKIIERIKVYPVLNFRIYYNAF